MLRSTFFSTPKLYFYFTGYKRIQRDILTKSQAVSVFVSLMAAYDRAVAEADAAEEQAMKEAEREFEQSCTFLLDLNEIQTFREISL